MTAHKDAQSVEARKARYSRELAAYTLRQWDAIRQTMEDGSNRDKSASPPRSVSDRPGSSRGSEKGQMSSQGVRAHDYAQNTHRQMSSGRAVAA